MKLRKFILIAMGIFSWGNLFAQTAQTIRANVTITDDPTTASVTEGNLILGYEGYYEYYDPETEEYKTATTGLYSISAGGGLAFGAGSLAFGYETIAQAENSIAMGWQSSTSGGPSIAIGEFSNASNRSIVVGHQSSATSGSITIGYDSYASNGSFALGNMSIASANYSVAMGENVDATAPYSKAMGLYLTSSSYAQTTIGLFGLDISYTSSVQWVATDPLFVIGNGSNWDNRSNALVILKNGNTSINGDTVVSGKITSLTASEGIPMGAFGVSSED